MGIAHRRLHLRMAEELAHREEVQALLQGVGGKAVAEIVNAQAGKAGPGPDTAPRPLQVGYGLARNFAGDEIIIVRRAGQAGQNLEGPGRKRYAPCAGFRIGQAQALALHIGPFRELDFGEAAAGMDQQIEGAHHLRRFSAIGQASLQRLIELGQLLQIEKGLAFALRIFGHMAAGVRAIGAQAPDFQEIEHLREHAQGAVGLIGPVTIVMMKLGNIGAGHIDDFETAERRLDKVIKRPAVFALGRGLATHQHMFGIEALTGSADARGAAMISAAGLLPLATAPRSSRARLRASSTVSVPWRPTLTRRVRPPARY